MRCTSTFKALVLALTWPLAARAQGEFRPGYIVPTAGDTVRGEIELRDHYANSMQCHFRTGPAAAVRSYHPGELRAYGVPAEDQQFRTIVPPPGPTPYFGRVLVSGPASLYLLRDADRVDHYYLDAPDFALAELVYIRTMLPGQTTLRADPRYRLTLQQAMPNCPAVEALLPRLPFNEDALRHVVTVFDACRGVAVVGPPPQARQRPRLGVLLGGQLISSSLMFTPRNYSQPTTFELPNQGGLLVGLRLNVPLSSISRRLALETELSYAHQHYASSFGDNSTFGGTRQSFDITLDYLRLPVLLRYSLPGEGVRPVLELGSTLAYAARLASAYTTVDYYNRTTTGELLPNNQRRLQEGLMGGVGLAFAYWQDRRAALLLRYEADTGWTVGDGLGTTANRFYALLTLDLTK